MELMTLFMNHHTVCLIFNATLSYSEENVEQQGPIKLKSRSYLQILSLLWDFITNLSDLGSLSLFFHSQDNKIRWNAKISYKHILQALRDPVWPFMQT